VDFLFECVVLLVFDDDFIIFLFLFIDEKVYVEILVSDVFSIDLHLRVAFRSLLKIFCDFPRHFLLEGRDDVRILQKLRLCLTKLRINVLVLS
jgi:hypothetical protein